MTCDVCSHALPCLDGKIGAGGISIFGDGLVKHLRTIAYSLTHEGRMVAYAYYQPLCTIIHCQPYSLFNFNHMSVRTSSDVGASDGGSLLKPQAHCVCCMMVAKGTVSEGDYRGFVHVVCLLAQGSWQYGILRPFRLTSVLLSFKSTERKWTTWDYPSAIQQKGHTVSTEPR